MDVICGIVADNSVFSAAGIGVLDHRTAGDAQIADLAVEIGEGLCIEIEPLIGGAGGQVDRVDAAAIINRGGRAAEDVHICIRRGVGAVGGVAAARIGVGAIEVLNGQNVGHLRGDHVVEAGIDEAVLRLAEIGHDRRLPAFIGVMGVVRIGGAAVVIAGMAEPERVPDLVDIGLVIVAGQRGAIGVQPLGRDVDIRGIDLAPESSGTGKGTALVVIEGDLGRAGDFLELDAGDIGPGLQGIAGQEFAVTGQACQVDRQGVVGADIKAAGA